VAREYRTLGELRSELRAALGYGASGAASGANQTLIDAKLRDAQTMLYWAHDWAHLRSYETKQTGASATLIDYPTDANPDRIKAISVYRGGVWSPPLSKGISASMYTYQANESWPQRWEPYDQIELWPQTDQDYQVRIFYIKALDRFTQDSDRASIDDTMIMLVATALAKAHYRHPDFAEYKTAADNLVAKLKAKSWGKDVFRPDDWTQQEPLVRPETV
jgi:hypothetical protein